MILFIANRIRKASKKAFTTRVQKMGTVSVALGLACLLLAFLVMSGFQKNITRKLTSFQGQCQITKYTIHRTFEYPPLLTAQIQPLLVRFAHQIDYLQAFAYKTVLVQHEDYVEGLVLKGVDLTTTHHMDLAAYIVDGRPLMLKEGAHYSQEILLSERIATKLQAKVGDQLLIATVQEKPHYRKLNIVGIYKTYLDPIDDKIALCDLKLLQRFNHWPDSLVGGYDVFLKAGEVPKQVAEELLDYAGYDLDISTLQEKYPAIFDWLAMMRKDIIIFLTLILLVANTNVVSIVIIQIIERTRMIGLLKTMGARNSFIQLVLCWNNLHMIVKGILLGNCIALGLAGLQDYFRIIRLDPIFYYVDYLPIDWQLKTILQLNLLIWLLSTGILLVAIRLIIRRQLIKNIIFR